MRHQVICVGFMLPAVTHSHRTAVRIGDPEVFAIVSGSTEGDLRAVGGNHAFADDHPGRYLTRRWMLSRSISLPAKVPAAAFLRRHHVGRRPQI